METYIGTLKEQLDRLSRPDMLAFMRILLAARERGSRIFIMGNGGSAATASHFVCDFNKGLNQPGQKPFKFICLNDNIPAMLAWGNDQGYADIFVEQLRNLLEDGDIVVAISGSGNSPNIIRAVEYARARGCLTVGLAGYDGGQLKKLADHCVHVDINNMQIAEDVHMIIDHMAMTALKQAGPQ